MSDITVPYLLEILGTIMGIVNESDGVSGWHLNGDIATWDEFDVIGEIEDILMRCCVES